MQVTLVYLLLRARARVHHRGREGRQLALAWRCSLHRRLLVSFWILTSITRMGRSRRRATSTRNLGFMLR
jgi:hypothetical protein